MEGWEAYRNSVCSGCGHSSLHAYDPDNATAFVAESVTCYSCAAAESSSSSHSKPQPGERVSVSSWVGDEDQIEDEIDGHHLPPGSFDIDEERMTESPSEDGDLDG